MSDDNVGKKYVIQLFNNRMLNFRLVFPQYSFPFLSPLYSSPFSVLWFLACYIIFSPLTVFGNTTSNSFTFPLTPLQILYFLSLSAHLRSLLPALSSTSSQALRPLPPRIPLPVHPLSSLCTHPPTVPAFPISHTFSLGRSPS